MKKLIVTLSLFILSTTLFITSAFAESPNDDFFDILCGASGYSTQIATRGSSVYESISITNDYYQATLLATKCWEKTFPTTVSQVQSSDICLVNADDLWEMCLRLNQSGYNCNVYPASNGSYNYYMIKGHGSVYSPTDSRTLALFVRSSYPTSASAQLTYNPSLVTTSTFSINNRVLCNPYGFVYASNSLPTETLLAGIKESINDGVDNILVATSGTNSAGRPVLLGDMVYTSMMTLDEISNRLQNIEYVITGTTSYNSFLGGDYTASKLSLAGVTLNRYSGSLGYGNQFWTDTARGGQSFTVTPYPNIVSDAISFTVIVEPGATPPPPLVQVNVIQSGQPRTYNLNLIIQSSGTTASGIPYVTYLAYLPYGMDLAIINYHVEQKSSTVAWCRSVENVQLQNLGVIGRLTARISSVSSGSVGDISPITSKLDVIIDKLSHTGRDFTNDPVNITENPNINNVDYQTSFENFFNFIPDFLNLQQLFPGQSYNLDIDDGLQFFEVIHNE